MFRQKFGAEQQPPATILPAATSPLLLRILNGELRMPTPSRTKDILPFSRFLTARELRDDTHHIASKLAEYLVATWLATLPDASTLGPYDLAVPEKYSTAAKSAAGGIVVQKKGKDYVELDVVAKIPSHNPQTHYPLVVEVKIAGGNHLRAQLNKAIEQSRMQKMSNAFTLYRHYYFLFAVAPGEINPRSELQQHIVRTGGGFIPLPMHIGQFMETAKAIKDNFNAR